MADRSPVPKARTSICIRWSGKTFRLAWVNEDAQGVYFGIYGHRDFHVSYHTDGTVHFKHKRKALPASGVKTPLAAIAECKQLCLTAVPLMDDALKTATIPFKCDNRAVEVFILPGADITTHKLLNIDITVVNNSWEDAYVGFAQRASPDRVTLGLVLVPMLYWTDHKAAITVFSVLS